MSEAVQTNDAALTPEQYRICRQCGTEPPFTGAYWDCHDAGVYRCVCCGNALFDAGTSLIQAQAGPVFGKQKQGKSRSYAIPPTA
jgi:peptide-methionine (R)-S-oxide reductase